MRMLIAAPTFLLAVSLAAQTAPDNETSLRAAAAVATQALPTLRSLAEKVPTAVGLTAKEAADAQIGLPLPVFYIPLDRLKNYRQGDDPRSLLADMETVLFPVTLGSSVRSSITVQRKESRWIATDFGQVELIQRIEAARTAISGGRILLRIPALNLYFVATWADDDLTLVPIADDPALELRSKIAVSARKVFGALVSIAREHKGDPT